MSDLRTARANYAARLAEISANPKPSYSLDGESYGWTEYQKLLLDLIQRLDRAIAREDGAWEIVTRAE